MNCLDVGTMLTLVLNLQEEVPIGEADVRAVFGAGSGKVAGCMVTEGKLVKGSGIRVMRGKESLHVGTINSLRRVKELAKEVSRKPFSPVT